ncbi:MAG TPA: DUF389 domain-containing protein [Candidatus Paceibacterota bacterium]|nr:DUF389 domain-containing protein [Candidatus Paceibacterota bacterium]
MIESLFHNVTEAEKNQAIENIIRHASPRQDFFLMLILSISMAGFGVLLGSTVILIGSMLIAPLLYPLLSLSLGIIVADGKLITLSVYTMLKSVVLALTAAFLIGLLFAGAGLPDLALLGIEAGGAPSLIYAFVAVIAGFAAAFATTKPNLNETLPGVAIAVTLVPPLAIAGISISLLNWALASNALLLFLVNVIGIMFSAMIVFALFQFSAKGSVAERAVQEENHILEKEAVAQE